MVIYEKNEERRIMANFRFFTLASSCSATRPTILNIIEWHLFRVNQVSFGTETWKNRLHHLQIIDEHLYKDPFNSINFQWVSLSLTIKNQNWSTSYVLHINSHVSLYFCFYFSTQIIKLSKEILITILSDSFKNSCKKSNLFIYLNLKEILKQFIKGQRFWKFFMIYKWTLSSILKEGFFLFSWLSCSIC